MANAFVPDEKRRHQYFPVNEEPPDYDIASGRTSEAGPSRPQPAVRSLDRARRRPRSGDRDRHGGRRRRRRQPPADDVDALPSGEEDEAGDPGHHADDHRPDSEDSDSESGFSSSSTSSVHDFQELDLEEPEAALVKEAVLVRITKRIHRLTLRVDQVLYSYINATLMRYVYGGLLGLIVIALVYLFGGSIPTITIPKRYREDALRAYINEETSATNIRAFTEKMAAVLDAHPGVEALFNTAPLANWVHDEFVKLGVARNAIDDYFVYYPGPGTDGQALQIRSDVGDVYSYDPYDRDGRLRSFVTHGASGNVTGPLVFANYATPNDLAWLVAQGVELAGAVVIFKHDPGAQLAQQIQLLEEAGAVGCVVFADPTDFGGDRGRTFPDGPFTPEDVALRGDAALTWIQPGDVLTPGLPSLEKANRLNPEQSPALVHIPALSIPSSEAAKYLDFLTGFGAVLPESWQASTSTAGNLSTGTNSERAPQVVLTSLLDPDLKHPIFDVLSEIEGDESDQVLVVGASLSSISTVATLLEVARIFADLATKYAWKPRRSMIFAVWGGSEQNHLGSTEWVENQLKSLQHQGVAYLNLANAASFSDTIQVRATPSLSGALLDAMQHVTNVHGNGTVAGDLGLLSDALTNSPAAAAAAVPTSFSDATAFQVHAGLAVADLSYPDSHLYPGCTDSPTCIDAHVDPGFRRHAVLAKTFAMTMLELADEPFIPLDLHLLARTIESRLRLAANAFPQLDFGSSDLFRVLQTLDQATDHTMAWRGEWTAAKRENKEIESAAWSVRRADWNYAVATFHRDLVRSAGWTTWFAHPVDGPAQKVDGAGKRAWTLPHVRDALDGGDVAKAQGNIELLGRTILQAAQALHM